MFCIKTIVHETLHSCSITSQDPLLMIRYPFFLEGLTEIYAGYMLHKMSEKCYSNCWLASERPCQMSYRQEAKLWGSFLHIMPLNLTTDLYFYTGFGNFNSKMNTLVERIREQGYPQFENPLGRGSLQFFFNIQCEKCFKSDWNRYYDSNTLWCDFSGIKID